MKKYKYDFSLDTAEKNFSLTGLAERIKTGQRVLELGCSYGYLSKFLAEKLDCSVVGVDIDAEAIQAASHFCEQVIVANLDSDQWLKELKGPFDVVLCADVLEHLKNPVSLLAALKPYLKADSYLLASVPNIAHASVRLELLQGHFDYESLGILDETHLHFYTRQGVLNMLLQAGYICCDINYTVRDLANEVIEKSFSVMGLAASEKTYQLLGEPDAIAYQFIVEARAVKEELLASNVQPALLVKPLVDSGVYYSELKDTIANLQIDNKNHQENNKRFGEQVNQLKVQLEAEYKHQKNYRQEIEQWQQTVNALDDILFKLSETVENKVSEQKKLADETVHLHGIVAQLEQKNKHLSTDVNRLESVLHRIHSKRSYKVLKAIKSMPGNILKSLVPADNLKETVSEVIPNIPEPSVHDYTAWLTRYEDVLSIHKSEVLSEIKTWEILPKIAVLMPVYDPDKSHLELALQSVLNQYYPYFELCIADDKSTQTYVKLLLAEFQQRDARVKVIFRDHNGHISAASNSALALVDAEYVALMDHDDLLTPDALYWVAKSIVNNPDVELIYSDEDKMDKQGQRYDPHFKPDWNPELLLAYNFICHLVVYKTQRLNQLGGFNAAFDGAQDYDLVLRYTEKIDSQNIIHITKVLYHWRAVDGSTAQGIDEKPYAKSVGIKAVESALQRRHRKSQVCEHNRLGGVVKVRYALPDIIPKVSIIIPTRNGFNLLHRCIESIFARTDYTNYEILLVDNNSNDFITLRYLQRLQQDSRVTVIRDERPFNYSALNNNAVKQSSGEVIALLNNDLEIINSDWLTEMVSHAVHPEVGAVGAKLYYPNETIQHAGVIIGLGGVAGHSHKHFPRDHPGFCGRLLVPQNLSAVTAACLVLRKSVFNAVGGLDDKNLSVAFNDVDFCLRLQEQGFYNVWTPYAELYHHESASRGYEDTPEKQARFNREINYMQQRWGTALLKDTAYNVNLTLEREDFSLSWSI